MFGFDEDTSAELLSNLSLPEDYSNIAFDTLKAANSRYLKDLRVNFNNVLESEFLSKKEAALLAVCVASNDQNHILLKLFTEKAAAQGSTKEEIAEAIACASLLASNNITYRFRHLLGKEKYNRAPMKIKMNIMARPITGKVFFELMSLTISAINACEMCLVSHEKSLIELGESEDKIWDAIRLGGVVTSLSKVFH